MSSLKYLGSVSLVILLSTPISAHFRHMERYKETVSEASTSPFIKKSFYLQVERHDAFRGLPENVTEKLAKPLFESCPKIHLLPFSKEPFTETVRFFETDEFVNSSEVSQSKENLLSIDPTEQIKTEDMACQSVKSRIDFWSERPPFLSAVTKPVVTEKLDEGTAAGLVKSRVEFWSKKGSSLLASVQSVETIVLDEIIASKSVSSPVESPSNISSPAPTRAINKDGISDEARELAKEMARVFRLGVNTPEAFKISEQVDEKCKAIKLTPIDLLYARFFRQAFFASSQSHLREMQAERGKKWRPELPSLESLFLN